MHRYQSWGRIPKATPAAVHRIGWRSELAGFQLGPAPVLPYGLGRSYGDSCLNDGGVLIDTSALSHLIDFDIERGVVRCEAGVSLADLLEVIVPRGWFLPVSPGTQFVTIAGALANDIHGKNHHCAGTFGCHVRCFELLRSDGTRRECSPKENSELFRATIGGMGLTGLVVWVEIQLIPIPTPWMDVEKIRFRSFDEYLALDAESSQSFEYTVSWMDCVSPSPGRGLFMRANFAADREESPRQPLGLRVPLDLPSFLLNPRTVKLFNHAIYYLHSGEPRTKQVYYRSFFYPLDTILDWNRIYGKAGFFQYQFVVPPGDDTLFRKILDRIAASRQGSFLVVLKKLGDIASPGMMSFPRAGLTLALDFANKGQVTLDLLEELDRWVVEAGGAVYPAKDARMSPESFQTYYPQWKEFSRFVDPSFSSSFWRRVTAGAHT